MTFAPYLSFPNGFDWDSFFLGLLVAGAFMILFFLLVTALIRIGQWLSETYEEPDQNPPHPPVTATEEQAKAFYALSDLIESMDAYGKYRLELRGDGLLYLRADVGGNPRLRDYFEIPINEVDWDNLTEHDLVFYQRRRIQSQRTREIRP